MAGGVRYREACACCEISPSLVSSHVTSRHTRQSFSFFFRDRGCHRVLAVPMVIVKCIRRARPFKGDYGVVRMKVVDSQWVVEAVWLLRQL